MAQELQLSAPHISSGRNEVLNDTGRAGFCGPYVISAITGYPLSKVEDEIRIARALPEGAQPVVRGTTADDVGTVLWRYGFSMKQIADFTHMERKARPSVWTWMQKPRNAWAHYILAISKGKEGHWVLIKGVKLCDTFSDGKWQFVCDGPHKGAKIMEIYEVKRALDL